MNDQFTETTSTSWFSRIGGAFKGILVGIILFLIAFPLLWWNEGRAIARTHTLDAGRQAVISIPADGTAAAPDGQLIHISGMTATPDTLSDPAFGLSVSAIKLRRQVTMYQWEEAKQSKTTQNLGGGETTETTYSYRQVWSDRWIDSSGFKQAADHRNPPAMPYDSQTFEAPEVTLGAFRLGAAFIGMIGNFKDYPITTSDADTRSADGFVPYQGGYYRGTPENPRIGDVQVKFSVVEPAMTSAIGEKQGQRLEVAKMKAGSIALLDLGQVDAATMFDAAESANRTLTWGIRVGGLLLMWIGLGMILAPLKVLADVVPFIGSIVGAGIGLITGLIAVALAFLTIALAWVFYRPLLAVGLAVTAVLAVTVGGFKLRGARPVQAETAQ